MKKFTYYAVYRLRIIKIEQNRLELLYLEERSRHWIKGEHGYFAGSVSTGGGGGSSGGSEQNDEGELLERLKNSASNKNYLNTVNDFEKQLSEIENKEVKAILERVHKRTEYIKSDKNTSYFDSKSKDGNVYLTNTAKSSTIAHELFHKVDKENNISLGGMLDKCISADFENLMKSSEKAGQSLEDMLYSNYRNAFKRKGRMKEEYCGVSDIINGMTKGEVDFGYGHYNGNYWNKPYKLQKETFAQYGRIYFESNKETVKMIQEIFPETTSQINKIIFAVAQFGR